ncbi:RagB/SusD family nutrient uptake outer membrane protein [Dysgonomonas sp. GY617]|uniref:RagB/SusD family nutrient uptake outer membrane protein n=1 Tax=Dysgonomonas sp. GY617 TaxID=2780420 RepID=UPI001884721F|nr:RagB/SusD family nutrient uptake outer membrane protein [Dysgonomonas sp. GY617]MBF0577107.1 RagB/SusD family nutrient uptake outer membrane protein [Dysgonomonas sp. GY617]
MKKLVLSKALLALVLLVAFSSCNDKDDEGSIVGGSSVVKSDEEAVALVNGAYGPLQTVSSSFSFLIESATEGTISFEGEENEAGPEVSRFETKPTTWYPVKVYSRLYQAVGTSNDAIEKISVSTAVSEATKKVSIARAKFLRGLSYSYLVQLFGEVPLVLQTGTSVKTRSSINDVYTQIVKDLTEAEADLPEYDSSPIIPSKGAANAILARVYLAWGHNPLTQDQLAEIANSTSDPVHVHVDNPKLAKAVEYADKVIKSGKYSLLRDYTKLFGRSNESKAPEHIFTIRHDGDAVDAQGNHQTHCAFTFAFDLTKDNHIGPSNVKQHDDWDVADTRREFSYTTYLENPQENNKGYYFLPPVTLPRFGKGIDRSYENSVNHAITTNEVDRIEIRYAEVLLIKAEALAESGKTSEALPLVNQVRERAYGNTSHNLKSLTVNDVRKEWGYEFVYEQKNWLNLVRWKTLIATVKTVKDFEHFDSSYKTAGGTGRDGSTVSAFFAKVYKHLHAKYDNVRGKHYRFPIPTGEKGEDLGITPQNPGY